MKKWLSLLFTAFLVLALAACGNANEDNASEGTDEGQKKQQQ